MAHGSNESWRWMLSDFKRPLPHAPPSVCLPSTCLCEECVQQTGWVRGLKFTDRQEGEVTCLQDFFTCLKYSQNTQSLAPEITKYKKWTHTACWQVRFSVKMTGRMCEPFSRAAQHHQKLGELQSLCFAPRSITCSPNGGTMQFSLMNLLQSK